MEETTLELVAEVGGETAIRFLLDGLEVETIAELRRLVDAGREYEALMEPILETLRAGGVPDDLLP